MSDEPDQIKLIPKQEIPDKIRQRLYGKVLELFSGKDFHQVNIREISRSTGLSSSTLYRYFPSKEAIIFTILEEKMSEIGIAVKSHLQGLESTREILRKCLWLTLDFYDRNPGVAITAFITVPMRTWMQTGTYNNKDATQMIADIIAAGQKKGELDPELTVSQAVDLYYMFHSRQILRWYYNGCSWKLSDTLPGFFDLFWKAVRA